MLTHGSWENLQTLKPEKYTCGHFGCGREVGSEKGWDYSNAAGNTMASIYICPSCCCPTFFDYISGSQLPGKGIGQLIKHLPENVEGLYSEIRSATTQGAFTLAAMGCRKLLMHIAVEKGATADLTFVGYIDYLVNKHYAPPNSTEWVDRIRQKGNEANHEIKIMAEEDVFEIINFIEMLLKFIYEFPSRITP